MAKKGPGGKAIGGVEEGGVPTTTPKPKQPQYTLSFENLSVHVPGTKKSSCFSLHLRPLRFFATNYLGMSTLDRDPLNALPNVECYWTTNEWGTVPRPGK